MKHFLPDTISKPSRRGFLMAAGGTTAGLMIGSNLSLDTAGAAKTAEGAFNPFVIVAPDNTVTVLSKHLDKGQGAATGLDLSDASR